MLMERVTSIPGWHLLFPVASIVIFTTLHLARDTERDRARTLEIILMYSVGILGFTGMTGLLAHTLWAEAVAGSIGWPAGNPFQYEVGGANLAIGLLGFLGFWRRDFWLPYILARTVFAWTAGVVHVVDMVQHANVAPNNAGPILIWDFVVPVVLLALYEQMRRSSRDEPRGYIRVTPLPPPTPQ
jgi:hypothetical protein